MAHFNFVISQNAKWGHAGWRHQNMRTGKYCFTKKALRIWLSSFWITCPSTALWQACQYSAAIYNKQPACMK